MLQANDKVPSENLVGLKREKFLYILHTHSQIDLLVRVLHRQGWF